jgi:GntR family transcriptional regulator
VAVDQYRWPTRLAGATDTVRSLLERQIREGELLPGQRLPTEPELAARLGVGRNSLREALQSLEDSGLIVKRHGIGTFVTESRPVVQGGIERLASLTEFIAGEGRVSGSDLVGYAVVPANAEVRRKLSLKSAVPVAVIESVKTANGQPVAVCFDYIPLEFLRQPFDPSSIQASIFEGLQNEHGVNIRFAECEILPTAAHGSLTSMLSVEEGTPLLLLDQVHVDDTDRRVFHSKSYFPFNRFTFRLIRHR